MNEEFEFHPSIRFEIRYRSLFKEGAFLSFPCDAEGHVDLDALSNRARENYLYARAMVGRDYAHPAVEPVSLDRGQVSNKQVR